MRRLSLLCLIVLAAVAVAACGGSSASNAPASQPAAPASTEPAGSTGAACATAPAGVDAAATVEIKDFKFAPDPVTAKVGEVIAWTNQDSPPHTASLADGSCGTDQLATGITGALVFSVAGTYTYQCNIHPGQMKDYTIEITQ